MRLDRGLRVVLMKPYPAGHTAVPTDRVNTEDPLFQFGSMKGVWVEEPDLPDLIELRVDLIPVWVENEMAMAKLGDHASCPLYPSESIFSTVLVDYAGTGRYCEESRWFPFAGARFSVYQLEFPLPYLYEKKFLVQPKGRQIHWIPDKEQGFPLPLWAYGAQQNQEDVCPLVFSLNVQNEETQVNPALLAYWRERGVWPSRGAETRNSDVVFQDSFEEDQTRSLVESIEAGMSVIALRTGVSETGDCLKRLYISCKWENRSIVYKRGE